MKYRVRGVMKGSQFLENFGLSKVPHALLNGYLLDVSSPENFDVLLQENVQKQTIRLQMMIYHGMINDNVKIDEWWLAKETNPDIVARINQKAFSDMITSVDYFPKSSLSSLKSSNVSTWIIADFQNPINRFFAANTLKSVARKSENRIAIISNPKSSSRNSESESCSFEYGDLENLIETLESTDNCIKTTVSSKFLIANGINPGETVIVSNGLIIGPFSDEREYLKVEDFDYLKELWNEKGAGRTSEFFKKQYSVDDVDIKFYSAMARMYRKDVSRISFDEFKNSENIITFPPENASLPSVTITWISNPVSREAQQIISIVKLMSKVLNAKVEVRKVEIKFTLDQASFQIIFNPAAEILENPIKRFYRFVAKEELEFNDFGAVENHFAVFSNLPQKQLLTMSIETNDGWMIELKEAEYDLDNILLDSTSEDVESVYSLEHILVEGQSRKSSGEASDGLEIELQSGDTTYDTLVMLNLGYYQLKAEPGVWNLHLREGSSSEKYKFLKVDSKQVEKDIKVVVDSFTGKWIQLVVDEVESKKTPEPSKIEKLMNSAKSFFSTPAPSDTINVFSLASGHLYERFMRIMIVSVMKNTKTQKVKFWFLKNYLSPKFKKSIPLLADFYGFDYELVEYKWPKWLHQQTEKQRVMWGYKILFLDVLFPLNVEKIIFVDADQVVRADLQELMDFNLNGSPYGQSFEPFIFRYVPFCESRKEMEGFRFWKTGYWNNHLMGRRYHISALYVVDLKAFREFSAGDRLRGRYDSLSADPNSLSNLDQDLPNNMIHEVPIKSLPQDWLWCETWCDDNSKKTAKTIDLCNNPLTKEPKLNSAQRIIGEWKDLDEEISNIIRNDNRTKRSKLSESNEEKEEL
ncbi:hypothetical protein CRE_20712 [Caenorhabditis remanei]|uniref:Glucosyltransferase 24 catalytic domain-containing protein n=1 Tax=Caenorhabditis remanei TaxID=31234 RepID=E3MFI8_CAERE|nr:hypothetical protein CRE_20712 [Caenorhabditis remanei]